eukprot:TRINITY_DN2648_c0_g1_i1.p1 TRINITY_DN2648_c0_g1~~TRINITY_DN2648_c0_g1_i1.p1  ORF type:complete len:464 (+),score=16.80 TRINITY_DN2648_c0_g1_i1:190-1392(+)
MLLTRAYPKLVSRLNRYFSSAVTDYGSFYVLYHIYRQQHKDIEITKIKEPRPLPKDDFGFGQHPSDHLLEIYWNAEKGWSKPKISPLHNLEIHPMNTTLHYALEGFEGMKAYRDPKGNIRTFRPLKNAERLVRTSKELCFPTFHPEEFVKCLDELLRIDERWVPSYPDTLYIRPTIISMTNKLGIAPPSSTMLFVVTSPSTAYFKTDAKPLSLFVETRGVRAWPGGCGDAKVGANYAIGIKYVKEALDKGYNQVLWLTGKNISEVGATNFFLYWINKNGEKELVTPKLDGTILPGITRQSILELAGEDKRFITSEKPINIKDVVKAAKEKRVFQTTSKNIVARNFCVWNSSDNYSSGVLDLQQRSNRTLEAQRRDVFRNTETIGRHTIRKNGTLIFSSSY